MATTKASLQADLDQLRAECDAAVLRAVAAEAECNAAHQREAAMADVPRIIGRSPSGVQPAFDAIVERGCRLTDADNCHLLLADGDSVQQVAFRLRDGSRVAPLNTSFAGSASWLAFTNGRTVNIADTSAVDPHDFPAYTQYTPLRRAGTLLSTPLLRDGAPIGVLTAYRPASHGAFSVQHAALFEAFAEQAVIAIEHARLLHELAEALAQQTATSEILGIVSTSPTDLQPVFAAVAERAQRLLSADTGTVVLREGDGVHWVAQVGPTLDVALHRPPHRFEPLNEDTPLGWVVRHGRSLRVHGTVEEVAREYPRFASSWRVAGQEQRSILTTPLLNDGAVLGAIFVARADGVPFTERQIVLLETFAAQVVIAMQNTRLFNELQQRNRDLSVALERQTALAEVLRIISTSPIDVQPVLDAIAHSAARLCATENVIIWRPVDGGLRRATRTAGGPVPDEIVPVDADWTTGRAFLERRTMHEVGVPNLSVRGLVQRRDRTHAATQTVLAHPLLSKGEAVGVIGLVRRGVDAFTESEIALIQTFADQAVIAIENTRLFEELHQALARQTATSEVLEVIGRSPTDPQPVFEAIVERAARLCRATASRLWLLKDDEASWMAAWGQTPETRVGTPMPRTVGAAALACHETLQLINVTADHATLVSGESVQPNEPLRRFMQGAWRAGIRTVLQVPLMRDNASIGVLVLSRVEADPFSEAEVALVETFAAQAVIAIENARLFRELRQSNASLREALEQQTATAEVLQIMSSSPTNLRRVFDGITDAAGQLVGAQLTAITRFDGEALQFVSDAGPDGRGHATGHRLPLSRSSMHGRAYLERRTIAVSDFDEHVADYPDALPRPAQGPHLRSTVATPILRGDTVAGVLAVARGDVRPFSDREIALIEMFASQAAIAITNAQLFEELQQSNAGLREALEQQTATSEILHAISASPMDPSRALTLVGEAAVRFTGTRNIVVLQVEGASLRAVARTNTLLPPAPNNGPPFPIDARSGPGRAVLDRRTIHVPDL